MEAGQEGSYLPSKHITKRHKGLANQQGHANQLQLGHWRWLVEGGPTTTSGATPGCSEARGIQPWPFNSFADWTFAWNLWSGENSMASNPAQLRLRPRSAMFNYFGLCAARCCKTWTTPRKICSCQNRFWHVYAACNQHRAKQLGVLTASTSMLSMKQCSTHAVQTFTTVSWTTSSADWKPEAANVLCFNGAM